MSMTSGFGVLVQAAPTQQPAHGSLEPTGQWRLHVARWLSSLSLHLVRARRPTKL